METAWHSQGFVIQLRPRKASKFCYLRGRQGPVPGFFLNIEVHGNVIQVVRELQEKEQRVWGRVREGKMIRRHSGRNIKQVGIYMFGGTGL